MSAPDANGLEAALTAVRDLHDRMSREGKVPGYSLILTTAISAYLAQPQPGAPPMYSAGNHPLPHPGGHGGPAPAADPIALAAAIVAAYVAHNALSAADLPQLITRVHATIAGLGTAAAEPDAGEPPQPAVPVRKSITPDHLICLEDGKKFKSLKRHLTAQYNMTPEQYRR